MKKKKTPRKFLVIRFRQMGDAILSTALLNAIKRNFPDSEVHFVLNDNIEGLFAGHPSIDRIIPFTKQERHSPMKYLSKIFKVVTRGRYDVIIDMRSTLNTLPFTLFAPRAKYRIGIRKPYTFLTFNHRFPGCESEYMGTHDARLLSPLSAVKELDLTPEISLSVTDGEVANFRKYMLREGVDFTQPVMLCGVVAKDDDKTWDLRRMADVLHLVIAKYPDIQLIFNYAKGREEQVARKLYEDMGRPRQVRINVKAESMRQLLCMARLSDAYFGNEGGARHIAEAMGTPSLVVSNPSIPKGLWFRETPTSQSVCVSDLASPEKLQGLDYHSQYRLITTSAVWERLEPFMEACELKKQVGR